MHMQQTEKSEKEKCPNPDCVDGLVEVSSLSGSIKEPCCFCGGNEEI